LPLERQRQGATALLDRAHQALPIGRELARKHQAVGVQADGHVVPGDHDARDGKTKLGLIGAVGRARPAAILRAFDVQNEAQGNGRDLERAEPGAGEVDLSEWQGRVRRTRVGWRWQCWIAARGVAAARERHHSEQQRCDVATRSNP
jgi:hypothetical protein